MKILISLFLLSCMHGQNIHQAIKNFSNGKEWYRGEYRNGVVNGTYSFWYESGQKSFEENYENGVKVGKWTGWHEN